MFAAPDEEVPMEEDSPPRHDRAGLHPVKRANLRPRWLRPRH